MLKCDLCRDVFKDKYYLEKYMRYDYKKYCYYYCLFLRFLDCCFFWRRLWRSFLWFRRSFLRFRRSFLRFCKVLLRDDYD